MYNCGYLACGPPPVLYVCWFIPISVTNPTVVGVVFTNFAKHGASTLHRKGPIVIYGF